MTILKVYDTMQRARFEAEKYYQECLNCDMKVRFIFITHYYRIEVGENVFMFVSVNRQAEIRGQRFDGIDDCTTCGIQYPIE